MRLLSTAGVVVAAASAAALASEIGRPQAIGALWAIGLASPLAFDGQLVLGHALGAGVAGLLLVVAWSERQWSIPVAFVLAGFGSCLRSEALLFALALGLATGVAALVRRRWMPVGLSAAVLLGGLAGRLFESWMTQEILGRVDAPNHPAEQLQRGSLDAIVSGARVALLEPFVSGNLGERVEALLPVAVIFAVVSAALLLSRRADVTVAALFGLAALGCSAVWMTSSDVVSGIVWAFPALAIAVVTTARYRTREPVVVWTSLTFVLFATMVLLTQYEIAGGLEWGWRYAAIGLPALGPWLGHAFVRLREEARSIDGTVVVASVTAVCLLVSIGGVIDQRRTLQRTVRFLDATKDMVERTDAGLIVTNQRMFGRFAWPQSIRQQVMMVSPEATDEVLWQLARMPQLERIAFVYHRSEPLPSDFGPYTRTTVETDLGSGYRAIALVA